MGQLLEAIEAQGVQTRREEPAPSRRRFLIPGIAAAILAAAIAGYLALKPSPDGAPGEAGPGQVAEETTPQPAEARPSLAVVGLESDEETEETAWLATALAEIVATQLGAGGQLRIVGGEEVAETRQGLGLAATGLLSSADLTRLGGSLGTDYLVDGRFSPSGGELSLIRIELQLRQTTSGQTLAEGQATGMASQLFDVASRALGSLRQALEIEDLTPAQALEVRAALPEDPTAARLYSEGLQALREFDAPRAQDLFERAVKAEPNHPLPHSGLATAWHRLGYRIKAEEEARRAMELADRLSEPARLLLRGQHAEVAEDWPAAIRTYEELFEAFPDDLSIGLRMADVMTSAGRTEEARSVLQTLRSNPAEWTDDASIDLAQCRVAFLSASYEELKRSGDTAKEKAGKTGNELVAAKADHWIGVAWQRLGDPDEALAAFERARALFTAHGQSHDAAKTLELIAIQAYRLGDYDGAHRLFDTALANYRTAGDRLSVSRVLANQGKMKREQGHLLDSEELFSAALEVAIEIGARYEAACVMAEEGAAAQLSGDLRLAKSRYQQALSLYSQAGEQSGWAMSLTNLGEVSFLEADIRSAREFHENALAIDREIGDRSGIAYDSFRLGLVALNRGELTVARNLLDEAIALQKELQASVAAAETQIALAKLAIIEEDVVQATALARSAAEVLGSEGLVDLQVLALVVQCHSLLLSGGTTEAHGTLGRIEQLSEGSQDLRVPYAVCSVRADVAAAVGEPVRIEEARDQLRALIGSASDAGRRLFELELRLALARLEVKLGEGRATAEALAAEAEELGLGLIARLATEL